ncbi:hypothetical protein B0H13DRAFT_2345568 [Mycena leptocephala]|nr:hypothetical protein B0H13DRAFT_2345568 [Mycena leptocephala]
MSMVSLEDGDADGERTGTMFATHCSQLRIISLSLIPSPSLPSLFVIHQLVLDSQLQWALAVSLPPADTDTDPQRPHSALRLHCTPQVLPGTRTPRFRSCTAALHMHHSSTDTPPDADLQHCRYFCSLDLTASPSYSSHGPYAAPLTARDFDARPHAHCFYNDLASHVQPSSHFCLPLFTVDLARTIPTSVLHASHASPPLTRPSIRVGPVHRSGYPALFPLLLLLWC